MSTIVAGGGGDPVGGAGEGGAEEPYPPPPPPPHAQSRVARRTTSTLRVTRRAFMPRSIRLPCTQFGANRSLFGRSACSRDVREAHRHGAGGDEGNDRGGGE